MTRDDLPKLGVTRKGVRLNWHAVWILLGLAGIGGGGLGFFGFARSDDVTMEVKARIAEAAFEHGDVHKSLAVQIDTQEKKVADLAIAIGEVRNVQHWQAADQAADRVAKKGLKKRYAENYKYLFKRNMIRLKNQKLPCGSLNCADGSN